MGAEGDVAGRFPGIEAVTRFEPLAGFVDQLDERDPIEGVFRGGIEDNIRYPYDGLPSSPGQTYDAL